MTTVLDRALGPIAAGSVDGDERAGGRRFSRRRVVFSVLGPLLVIGVLGVVLAGRSNQFTVALDSAPLLILALAAVLQVVALLARSEAWLICVTAAGGTMGRRLLFRAAGVGYLASVLNGSVGMAARIASLRQIAPNTSPRASALVTAEVPIITVEIALTAIFSFTLIAPLGVPWWVPVSAVAIVGLIVAGLRRISDRRRAGLWSGLAVVRNKGRGRMIAFVLLAVCVQIARNFVLLHALGVDVSVLDAIALLIAMFTLGQLPVGPSLGAAAAVLILGAHGVAATAAAGVLLTVTGTIGSLAYAAWAVGDRAITGRRGGKPEGAAGSLGVTPAPVVVAPTSA